MERHCCLTACQSGMQVPKLTFALHTLSSVIHCFMFSRRPIFRAKINSGAVLPCMQDTLMWRVGGGLNTLQVVSSED